MGYSKEYYTKVFDQLLSQELCYSSCTATEHNIKMAIKRVLGTSIRQGMIKKYSGLVLDESLNIHFSVVEPGGVEFLITLCYGQ